MATLAVIGAGAMGGAIVKGVLTAGLYSSTDILILERSAERAEAFARREQVRIAENYTDLTTAEQIILAVKPQDITGVLRELAAIRFNGVVVSIAAGVTLAELHAHLPSDISTVRVMPNMPVSVNAGMIAVTKGNGVTDEQLAKVTEVFATLGRVVVVTEKELEALGALSGAGPGYAFVVLDALADAGVRVGLSRQLAIEAAAQTLYGAAKLQLTTKEHPAILRDAVTSPGGTTIAGIQAMEKGGLRAAIMDGVLAAHRRAEEMGKK